MLLRASGDEAGLDVDLDVAMDATKAGDAGVPCGAELLAFASAANRRSPHVSEAAAALEAAVGQAGLIEAAATVAAFNGLVRVADGTGIQLDPTMLTTTMDDRATLGIDEFAGAENSKDAATEPRFEGPGAMSLFS